jgi:hypothetical protein
VNNGVIVLGAGAVVVAGGAAAAALSSRAGHRENLRGVHPALVWLYDKWGAEGTHDAVIAPGDDGNWPYPGGLRTDASSQADAAAGGLSKATTLEQTPHGRGAAIDVWPKGFDPHRGFNVAGQLPGAELLMRAFGEWAEVQVHPDGWRYRWGGHFGDEPHIELLDWESLPFPPPDYGAP